MQKGHHEPAAGDAHALVARRRHALLEALEQFLELTAPLGQVMPGMDGRQHPAVVAR
jgi:hypothetical protein